MRALHRLWFTSIVAITSSAACGGSSEEGSGSTPVVASDFPARFSQTVCGSMADCCATNGFTHDYETCRASLDAQLTALLRVREEQQVRFDSAAAGACVSAYANALEACAPLDDSQCDELFVGLVQLGGACKESVECVDGEDGASAYCEAGVCTVDAWRGDPIARAEGQSCFQTCTREAGGWSCGGVAAEVEGAGACFTNDGLTCDPEALVCVPVPQEGEACTQSTGCAEGTFCESGTCVPQRTSGPCTSPDVCAAGFYCHFESRECVAQLPDGSACTSSDQCLIESCSDGVCRARIPVDAGVCVGLLD